MAINRSDRAVRPVPGPAAMRPLTDEKNIPQKARQEMNGSRTNKPAPQSSLNTKNGQPKKIQELEELLRRRDLEVLELKALLARKEPVKKSRANGEAEKELQVQQAAKIEKLNKSLTDAHDREERLKQDMQDLHKEIAALRREKEALSQQMHDLAAGENELKSEWIMEKERLQKSLSALHAKHQKLELKSSTLKKRMALLGLSEEEILADHAPSEDAPQGITADEIPSGIYSIRLYDRPDRELGVIRHPLSKEKAVFRGLDGVAIAAFMAQHRPQKPLPPEPNTVPAEQPPDAPVVEEKEAEIKSEDVLFTSSLVCNGAELTDKSPVLLERAPFIASINVKLPFIATARRLSEHVMQIGVTLLLKKTADGSKVMQQSAVLKVEKTRTEYARNFSIKGLASGKYRFEIYVNVPIYGFTRCNMRMLDVLSIRG